MAAEPRGTAPLGVLIVDDEPPARERLTRLVEELPDWRVVGCCASGIEALESASRHPPRVVLLDIRMPGMTGIETARHLNALPDPPAVVFTTAYDEYALAAFESHAVDYLLKPVRRERLRAALAHAARLTVPQLAQLSSGPEPLARREHIAVRVREQLKLIPVREVLFFRAEQKYVTVCHERGEDLVDESLKQLEEEFKEHCVRVHRSLLVMLAQIEALAKERDGSYSLRLRGRADPLPVSRRQLADLKRRLHGR